MENLSRKGNNDWHFLYKLTWSISAKKKLMISYDASLNINQGFFMPRAFSSTYFPYRYINILDNLENTKSWCIAGRLRINNFKTIRENENYIVATHDVIQEGKPKSNVLVYAEQINEEFIYWKIQRAFES